MPQTATKDELNQLHSVLTQCYLAQMKSDPSPALLSSVAKFLKDNLVCLVPESSDALKEAAENYNEVLAALETDDDEALAEVFG